MCHSGHLEQHISCPSPLLRRQCWLRVCCSRNQEKCVSSAWCCVWTATCRQCALPHCVYCLCCGGRRSCYRRRWSRWGRSFGPIQETQTEERRWTHPCLEVCRHHRRTEPQSKKGSLGQIHSAYSSNTEIQTQRKRQKEDTVRKLSHRVRRKHN